MYNLKVNNKKYIPQGIPGSQKLEKSSVCCTIAEFLIYDLCFSKLPDEPHDFEHRVVFTQSFQRPIEFKELSDSKGIQSLLCIIGIFQCHMVLYCMTLRCQFHRENYKEENNKISVKRSKILSF